MKINIRESLGKLDLLTDNKYDLRNHYDSSKLSNLTKNRLAEALNKNAPASKINRILNENFAINVFSRDSEEYEKLEKVADYLTNYSPNNIYYRVEKTYFDFGQDWMWTTIIAYDKKGNSWQAIYPKVQEDILLADSDEELEEIAKKFLRESRLDKGFSEAYEPEDDRTEEEIYQDWLDAGAVPNYDEEPPFESLKESYDDFFEIETNLRSNSKIKMSSGSWKVDTIYLMYDPVVYDTPHLIGYAHDDNGNYDRDALIADEIVNCDLSNYMDGIDIVDVEGMIKDNPKYFYTKFNDGPIKFDESAKRSSKNLKEASYGGAYDIEDDMYFTKEELVEFADEFIEKFSDWSEHRCDLEDLYMDSPKHLVVDVYDQDDGVTHRAEIDIDMRKIRTPKSIYKYGDSLLKQWKDSYLEYHEYDESLIENKKVGSNKLSQGMNLPGKNFELVKVVDGVVSSKDKYECRIYSRELDSNYKTYGFYQGEVIFDDDDPQLIDSVFPDEGTKVKLAIYRVPEDDPDHVFTGDYFVDYIDGMGKSLNEEVEEQLYKIVCKNGPSEWPFESALSYEDAEELIDYYNGRWIDEKGFEWSMEIEEDDESTERVYPFDESLNEARIIEPKYKDGDIVFIGDADGYHGTFLIKGDFKNIPEELYHNIRRITKYGNLDKPYYKVEYKIDSNHLFEEDYRKFFEYITPILKNANISILRSEKDIDYNESLSEKLIPAPQEVVDELLSILDSFGFVLDDSLKHPIGKTWSGNTHVQVINKDSHIEETDDPDIYSEQLKQYIPDEMENEIDALSEREKVRITYNFGINRNWQVTGGLDVWEKHVPGKQDESLNESYEYLYDEPFLKTFDDFVNRISGLVADELDDEVWNEYFHEYQVYNEKYKIKDFENKLRKSLEEKGLEVISIEPSETATLVTVRFDSVEKKFRFRFRLFDVNEETEEYYIHYIVSMISGYFTKDESLQEGFEDYLYRHGIQPEDIQDDQDYDAYWNKFYNDLELEREKEENLKESIDISDYEELNYPLRDGDKYYQLYRKIENGKGVWAAAELDKYGSDVVGEPFKITYEQARGFEPIEDSSIRKLSRDLGKKLLPKRENLNESVSIYDTLKRTLLDVADYYITMEYPMPDGYTFWKTWEDYKEDVEWTLNFESEAFEFIDVTLEIINKDIKNIEAVPGLKEEDPEYEMLIDLKRALIRIGNDLLRKQGSKPYYKESLTEGIEDLDSISSTKAKDMNDADFKVLKPLVDEYLKDRKALGNWPDSVDERNFVKKWYKLADKCKEIAKNGLQGITGYGRLNDFIKIKILELARSVDNTFLWYVRNQLEKYGELYESLNEAIEDEVDFEEDEYGDFDDDTVEEGTNFIEDGTEWVWVERVAGPIHLDFDNWAVWAAREYVDPRDFITMHDDGKGYDFDGDGFKKKAMAAPINYFVVDEDTGFIDWGPVETQTEAQDFLNGKVEDWEKDESLRESKELKEWYTHMLHYEDIGDGREYDYEVDHEDLLDYILEIAIDEDDAPEDAEEYMGWVEDNFDKLFKKYEYNILNHFEEDASQEEYDKRYEPYE